MIIQRVRPSTALIPMSDFSFPSGHATVSIVFCLLCRYVLQGQIKTKRVRYSLLVVMIASALLVGMSRILLNVHRFTDVLGGFLLGFFLLTTNILVWKILFNMHLQKQKIVKKRSKKQLIDVLL
jgi:undecaprenyl-diphosphatase